MGFLELFGQINWIISLLMAIILSIIANLFTPSIRNWLAKWSESRSSARVEELKSDLEEISKYANSPSKLSLLISHTIIQVLILFSLASAIASLGTAMPFMLWHAYIRLDGIEYLTPAYLSLSSLLYLVGVMNAQKVSRIINKVRNFDNYKSKMEHIITNLEKSDPGSAIPVMAVNAYERRLVYMPIRKHFMILHASTRHITWEINDGRRYNFRQLG